MKAFLLGIAGSWTGHNRLWLDGPRAASLDSEASADIDALADGKLVRLDYAWTHEGHAHRGSLLLAWNPRAERVTGAWVDTFHQSGHVMVLEGTLSDLGEVDLRGSYPAPPGPDWGWGVTIAATGTRLRIGMDNIDPQGAAEQAVEIVLERV